MTSGGAAPVVDPPSWRGLVLVYSRIHAGMTKLVSRINIVQTITPMQLRSFVFNTMGADWL